MLDKNIAENDILDVKSIHILPAAIAALAKIPVAERKQIIAKIRRYAETGAGKVTRLQGRPEFRLRQGDYRVIFQETADDITVVGVGHRRDVYD